MCCKVKRGHLLNECLSDMHLAKIKVSSKNCINVHIYILMSKYLLDKTIGCQKNYDLNHINNLDVQMISDMRNEFVLNSYWMQWRWTEEVSPSLLVPQYDSRFLTSSNNMLEVDMMYLHFRRVVFSLTGGLITKHFKPFLNPKWLIWLKKLQPLWSIDTSQHQKHDRLWSL